MAPRRKQVMYDVTFTLVDPESDPEMGCIVTPLTKGEIRAVLRDIFFPHIHHVTITRKDG